MLISGIATGLCAAFFSALSYLATRYFTHTRGASSTLMLLILSHVQMGAVSAIALPILLWSGHLTLPPAGQWAGTLIGVVVIYLIGHTGLLMALRYSEPSRVSPMMALKLIVLAAMAMTFGHTPLTPLQWVAIGFCVVAGISLNYTGGKLHVRSIIGLAVGVMFYSVSDWNSGVLMDELGMSRVQSPFVAFFLIYILAGAIMTPLLLFWGSRKGRDWLDAVPFSFTWLVSVVALYGCFALAGVVFGNIMQSTRGIISIALAAVLARLGHVHLESLTPRSVMLRRIGAAVLMTVAISLYSYEKGRLDRHAAAAASVPPR